MEPIGLVECLDGKTFILLEPRYGSALQGLEGFSHIWVIFWFHENDSPENRHCLKVHPRRNPANPLTGVFATRAPVRPNLLGMDACRLVHQDECRLEVESPGSSVLDIKPYIPSSDSLTHASTPSWLGRLPT